MSFWSTDNGETITPEKEYSAGTAYDNTPIPKNTNVLVSIEDASWKAGYQVSQEFVNLKVRVLKPEGYANRVLFFKLWVDELNPGVKDEQKAKDKRAKHKNMLLAIDANAKGKLAKGTSRPTNEQLALALVQAQFVATLGVWDKEEDGKKVPGGNWLMAAKPKTAEVTAGPVVAGKARNQAAFDDLDDDVPF
jgi:hypothetical protein